jgi:hypothetical protein
MQLLASLDSGKFCHPDIDRPSTFPKRRTATVAGTSNVFPGCEAAAFRVVGRTTTASVDSEPDLFRPYRNYDI